jgi:hypothetical protein
MYNHTLIGQLLQMFPRLEFQKCVRETKAEYHARGFTSWNHFTAMLFGQLAGQDSLRGIEAGLATQSQSLCHLGITPVHRSTLSYANEHRSFGLFEKIFYHMLSKCRPLAPGHKFKFKNPLYSIDSSTIDLCLSLYDWALFRATKGAVKLHVKLNHSGYLPSFAVMTYAAVHDVTVSFGIPMEKGDVVVFDRGYNSLELFKTLENKGVFFVVRLKDGVLWRTLSRKDVSSYKHIRYDRIVEPITAYAKNRHANKLRVVCSYDPVSGKTVRLITNNFSWSPKTISQIYKERWQIELFFKTLKQQLKVKSFVGTSRNALLSQLWVALITYLLLSYLKFKSKFKWSIYTLCAVLPTNLFARRNLWDWLNNPFNQKSDKPPDLQLRLAFG